MPAESLVQQQDIKALLGAITELANVHIFSELNGVTESEVDAALSATRPRAGKKPGLVVIVAQPIERPDPDGADSIQMRRTHLIRIIEVPDVNKGANGTQITADLAKDYIIPRFHMQGLGAAWLVWRGSDPFVDKKGGYGWELAFSIQAGQDSLTKASTPILAVAAGTCTISAPGAPSGTAIYYTTDGSAPVPGGATVTTYSAPFAVSGGTLVRAATTATGYTLGDFAEVEA